MVEPRLVPDIIVEEVENVLISLMTIYLEHSLLTSEEKCSLVVYSGRITFPDSLLIVIFGVLLLYCFMT